MIYMLGNPVVWNESNQILGYQINVYLNDSTVDKAHIIDYALAIQDRGIKDQYNQLSGREMTAFFNNGELYNVLVEGNAMSLYYLVEDDGTVIGLNKTESPYLSMDIEEDKLQNLNYGLQQLLLQPHFLSYCLSKNDWKVLFGLIIFVH